MVGSVDFSGLIVVRLGFEPRQTESESVVLPLHHRTIGVIAITKVASATKNSKK